MTNKTANGSEDKAAPHTGEIGSILHEACCKNIIAAVNLIIDHNMLGTTFNIALFNAPTFKVTIERIV